MIGKQIQKPVQDWSEYTKAALWCNANKAMLEDKGELYEVVALPEQILEEARTEKLTELAAAFSRASQTAHCMSSAGFEINADEIANRNIEGLVLVLKPEERTLFRAYDNSFHEVTKEQLETMRKEIVVNSQRLYQTKWQIEAAIEAAETVGELDAIVIAFEPEITGGQPIAGASYNTDTPVAFTEQRNQSIYGSEVSDGQTVEDLNKIEFDFGGSYGC